jgi:hypothetical protein
VTADFNNFVLEPKKASISMLSPVAQASEHQEED